MSSASNNAKVSTNRAVGHGEAAACAVWTRTFIIRGPNNKFSQTIKTQNELELL